MRDSVKKLLCIVLGLVCVFSLAACGSPNHSYPDISVNADGYVVVNGIVTDHKVVDNEVSLFETYKNDNPSYIGDETQWLKDIVGGKINVNLYRNGNQTYKLIENGVLKRGFVVRGSCSTDNDVGKDYLSTANAIIRFDDIIMPLTSDSSWSVKLGGVIFPSGSGGGQFLNSKYDKANGRILFGCNWGNQTVFFGICVNDTYLLHEFSVLQATLSSDHDYDISFNGEEFRLSIDGGASVGMASISLSQGSRVTITDNKVVAKEIISKVLAANGQKYFILNAIGSDGFFSNSKFRSIQIDTSSVAGYRSFLGHPLAGKVIYHLGSSITDGNGSKAFDVCLNEFFPGSMINIKSAIGGTTLVNSHNGQSYVERLRTGFDWTNSVKPDVILVQLSTNDFSTNKPYGTMTGTTSGSFDNATIIGAIEDINAYVREKSPDTKVLFWASDMKTGYAKYVEYSNFLDIQMQALSQKWGFEICDMLNREYVRNNAYFTDDIHFTDVGYRAVFFPSLTCKLIDIL